MDLSEPNIASRIAALRQEIVVLGKYHNANYATTVKLPSEVLVQIFACLAQAPTHPKPEYPESTEPPRAHYTWIKEVTHVCSTWRYIALATPLLWTSVLVGPKEWAEQVLQRAQGVPLDLKFPMLEFLPKPPTAQKETDTDLIKMVFSRPQNIRSVDIAFDGHLVNETMELMSSLLSGAPLPHLERLKITSRSIEFHIPDELFSQSHLRHLSLDTCVANLSTPRFSLLRTLSLALDLGIAGVLDSLSAMPELEVLFLQDSGYSRSAIMEDAPESVIMPSLQEITLKSDFYEIMDLFKVLVAPVICSVVVETAQMDDIQSVLHAYSFLQLSHLSPTSAPQSLTIEELDEAGDFRLLHSSPSQDGKDKMISISGIVVDLDSLWTSIPKHNVQSVVLTANMRGTPAPPPLMPAVIASVAHLSTLRTLQAPYLSFAEAFTSNEWHSASAFPSLQTLNLDCRFRKPSKASLKRLRGWANWREESGSLKIPHFTLRGCFKESAVAALRSSAGELIMVQSTRW
ncbi:hypothetical protein PTI98_001129 [Pleurotus ostreatus]|nr:hypothetical protein PTI98_001129 [Pleurotus ostreatus]